MRASVAGGFSGKAAASGSKRTWFVSGRLREGRVICEGSILVAIKRSNNNSKNIKSEKENAEGQEDAIGSEVEKEGISVVGSVACERVGAGVGGIAVRLAMFVET